jgi:hypothetical protein
VKVGEFGVVNAHQVQNRRVQVVDVDFFVNGVPAVLVGSPIGHTTFHTAACHPHRETKRVVLSAVVALGGGRASELTAPDDECVF